MPSPSGIVSVPSYTPHFELVICDASQLLWAPKITLLNSGCCFHFDASQITSRIFNHDIHVYFGIMSCKTRN
jgi:hypothetical protein